MESLTSSLKEVFNFSTNQVVPLLVTVVLAFVIGLFVYLIYRLTFSGVIYSKTFNMSLVMLTMVSTMVILFMSNNLKLSLGMVGALSIVRFRTAIKEPLDIAFLFWAIAAGIVLAAGMIPLAVIGSIIIGIILLVFVNRKSGVNPYIVVLSCLDPEAEKAAVAFLQSRTLKSVVKSKTASKGGIELNMEIRLKEDDTDFINELASMSGIQSAVLVSYNGDYMG